jgi:lycopene beta-cyclase
MDSDGRFDYIIAGVGLAGGLVALALAARRPWARVALVETEQRLGGNHTWSFHDGDLPDEVRPWVEPLVAHRWAGYSVRFPDGDRRFNSGYASITSTLFDRVVRARLASVGFDVRCGDGVAELGPGLVRTVSGLELRAPIILDARGLARAGGEPAGEGHPQPARPERCGYQKFLGLEVELAVPARLDLPVLMDATVPQLDGFRFVYLLPLGPRRLLVEDTYYANTPTLDRARLRERVLGYLRQHGHQIVGVVREEAGVLPLPLTHLADAPAGTPFTIGYRGGWYHPLTGYSFPVAARLALVIAAADGPEAVAASIGRAWTRHVRQARLCQWLARLMFTAVAPERRWRLLARFYRLPAPTIERFYALRMTVLDRLRLLAGPPPRWLSRESTRARAEATHALGEVS